jgi:hypothetical protein
MEKRPTFEEFKEEVLKNPKVKAAYEALRPEFEALIQRLKARKKRVSHKKK